MSRMRAMCVSLTHALQVELGQVVLKRFLLLVLLLDQAAVSDNLPASAPLLFKDNALCKQSSQVCCLSA